MFVCCANYDGHLELKDLGVPNTSFAPKWKIWNRSQTILMFSKNVVVRNESAIYGEYSKITRSFQRKIFDDQRSKKILQNRRIFKAICTILFKNQDIFTIDCKEVIPWIVKKWWVDVSSRQHIGPFVTSSSAIFSGGYHHGTSSASIRSSAR